MNVRVVSVGFRLNAWWFSRFSSLTASGKKNIILQHRVGGKVIARSDCHN